MQRVDSWWITIVHGEHPLCQSNLCALIIPLVFYMLHYPVVHGDRVALGGVLSKGLWPKRNSLHSRCEECFATVLNPLPPPCPPHFPQSPQHLPWMLITLFYGYVYLHRLFPVFHCNQSVIRQWLNNTTGNRPYFYDHGFLIVCIRRSMPVYVFNVAPPGSGPGLVCLPSQASPRPTALSPHSIPFHYPCAWHPAFNQIFIRAANHDVASWASLWQSSCSYRYYCI